MLQKHIFIHPLDWLGLETAIEIGIVSPGLCSGPEALCVKMID